MSEALRRGIWVTGVGAVSAAGCGAERLREALRGERSCGRPVPEFGGASAGVAAEFAPGPGERYLDRGAAMFLSAATEAWRRAGLESPDPERTAVVEGGSLGPMAALLDAHRARRSGASGPPARARDIVRFMPGAGGVAFAQLHGLRGPVFHLSAGSASAACAMALAADQIAAGAIDVAIAGGAECPLQDDIVATFQAAGIAATDAAEACRPFDRRRRRTMLGEGAGALVVESSTHASARGAFPIAILAGWGLAGEAHHRVRPDPSGAGVREAARRALAGHARDGLGWIKAHGTGTRLGDAAEYRGLTELLNGGLAETPVTSLKPLVGHCLGASAAVEAVAVTLALEDGIVPATLGTQEVDAGFPGLTVPGRPMRSRGGCVLALSESFGGRCAALLFAR